MRVLKLKHPSNDPLILLESVDEPVISSNQILVRVAAVGLCYHDIAVMNGTLTRGVKDNVILGHEISGTIVEIGSDIKDLEIGQNIVTSLNSFCDSCEMCLANRDYRCQYAQGFGHGIDGGLSEFIKLAPQHVSVIPESHNLIEACLYACPIGVSNDALKLNDSYGRGDTVVIFGVGGGLGVHAAQIALSKGANVISLTSSPNKLEKLEQLPVGQVFLMDEFLNIPDLIFALTEDQGAKVVFNPVGSQVFLTGLESLSNRGNMIVTGEILGKPVNFNLAEIIFRDAKILGSSGVGKIGIQEAVNLVDEKQVTPIIGKQYGFSEISEAYRAVKNKEIIGRAVIIPD